MVRYVTLSAVLATASVGFSDAVGSSFRHLEALGIQATAATTCLAEVGFDYAGNDIKNVPGAVKDCCDACANTPNCRAWSWSNFNGGTCWLKSKQGDVVVNANVTSGVYGSNGKSCQISQSLDYVGTDIGNQPSSSSSGCCDKCRQFPGCRAYSWSDLNGGTCWFKSKVDKAIYKEGVQSALAYPKDEATSCPVQEFGKDYIAFDIGSKPSATPDGCCAICKGFQGCAAYSWTTQSGGTCYLKSRKGNAVADANVVSAEVYADPYPNCKLYKDGDFVGNDIANVPSKDLFYCCAACTFYPGCKAFSWSNYNGGTCWLKSAAGNSVSTPNVNCGTI